MLLNVNIFNDDCQKSVIEMNVTDDFLVGIITYDDINIENLYLFRAMADDTIVIWGLIGVNQQFSITAIKWMNLKPNLIVNKDKAKKLGISPHSFIYQPEVIATYMAQSQWLSNNNLMLLIPSTYEYIIPPDLFNSLVNNKPYTDLYHKAILNIDIFYNEVY